MVDPLNFFKVGVWRSEGRKKKRSKRRREWREETILSIPDKKQRKDGRFRLGG